MGVVRRAVARLSRRVLSSARFSRVALQVQPLVGPRSVLRGASRLSFRPGLLRLWRLVFLSPNAICTRDPPVVYPTIVIRAVARCLDFVVLVVLILGMVAVIGGVVELARPGVGYLASAVLALLLPVPVTWLYFCLQEAGRFRATVGARACHLRVVDTDGRQLTFGRACVRHAARYVTVGSFGLGLLLWFFTPRRQFLHDLLSGSVVVRDVPRAVVEDIDRQGASSSGVFDVFSVMRSR